MEKKRIKTYKYLEVFNLAFTSAMKVFELSKSFPAEERYSLVDQVRRSSRSVCANIVEAFRKRRYPAAFVSKLSDADGEAGETQLWIEFAVQCGYLEKNKMVSLLQSCDFILGKLVTMMQRPEAWKVWSLHSRTHPLSHSQWN